MVFIKLGKNVLKYLVVKYLEYSEKMKTCPITIIFEKKITIRFYKDGDFFLILGTLISYVLNSPSS